VYIPCTLQQSVQATARADSFQRATLTLDGKCLASWASRVNICESFRRVISTGFRRMRSASAFPLLALCSPHEKERERERKREREREREGEREREYAKATDLIIAILRRPSLRAGRRASFLANALLVINDTVCCCKPERMRSPPSWNDIWGSGNRCRCPIKIPFPE